MTLKLITAPGSEPVTLAEAKLQCEIDSDITKFDSMLSDIWIPAARRACEQELSRTAVVKIISQTWELVLDRFPDNAISLEMAPVQSIVSLKYINEAGDEQTLDPSLYFLDEESRPGYVLPAENTTWPTTNDTANAVRVRFVVGQSAAEKDVKSWILMRVATLYQFRGQIAAGATVTELPSRFIDGMLDGARV